MPSVDKAYPTLNVFSVVVKLDWTVGLDGAATPTAYHGLGESTE